ncbi:hypothetical protein T09_9991 [Trichinella sp. T9]|nr:hypothetical protein T09_9991 [Trichinella sp. T9]
MEKNRELVQQMAPKASTLPMLIHKEFANLKFSLYATSLREFPQMEHLVNSRIVGEKGKCHVIVESTIINTAAGE